MVASGPFHRMAIWIRYILIQTAAKLSALFLLYWKSIFHNHLKINSPRIRNYITFADSLFLISTWNSIITLSRFLIIKFHRHVTHTTAGMCFIERPCKCQGSKVLIGLLMTQSLLENVGRLVIFFAMNSKKSYGF